MKDIVRITSITQVHDLLGLPKPKHPLVTLLELGEHMPSHVDFQDTTYVFDLYQVSFKAGICGSLSYGRNTYDFQEGTMLFTGPGQALRYTKEEEQAVSTDKDGPCSPRK